jgi:hypothetical protein
MELLLCGAVVVESCYPENPESILLLVGGRIITTGAVAAEVEQPSAPLALRDNVVVVVIDDQQLIRRTVERSISNAAANTGAKGWVRDQQQGF